MRTGRPRKQIDKSQFESLCGIQCTIEEVCQFFECDEVTLNRWCKETYKMTFSQVFKAKRGVGKISLRRAQYQLALKGNSSMLIWLGKQYLDQAENPSKMETDQEIEDLTPIAELINNDENGGS